MNLASPQEVVPAARRLRHRAAKADGISLRLIPYCANRGVSKMTVWLPER